MKTSHAYYICWYIADEDNETYKGNVTGVLKMKYVISQMQASGISPYVVSLAQPAKKGFFRPQRKKVHGGDVPLMYLAGFNGLGRLGRILNNGIKLVELFFLLIFSIKKSDKIVLYHNYPQTRFVASIKRWIRADVIIEVEELYGYSPTADRPWVEKEIRAVKRMDAFICVNEGMPKSLDLQNGNYVVNYGAGVIPERTVARRNDGKIHVVYAGTIEGEKKGALTAVDAARYLTDNYVMHIIGFGEDKQISLLRQKIDEVNQSENRQAVCYDGCLSGDELDAYLFGCHIGLSSNVMRPHFANNSFPSKVITYMCHDLSVVLGYAEAFYDVPMSEGWTFYHAFTPEQIASAIMSAHVVPEGYYHDRIHAMNQALQRFFQRQGATDSDGCSC